jgi:hypothetical protein
VKIITLWQPWATLIALGLKKDETRGFSIKYRGPMAIHAAKRKMTKAEWILWLDILECAGENIEGFNNRKDIPLFEDIPYGAIVATTEIASCKKMTEQYTVDSDPQFIYIGSRSIIERKAGDWRKDRFAWGTKNSRAVVPFPFVGSQGIRNLPEEVVEKLIYV